MKTVLDFFKSNMIVWKWTVAYFVGFWLILRYLFGFDIFLARHWWKFFHATLHGFGGLVFCLVMYSAIPIYIATVAIICRKKEPIFTLPIPEKIKSISKKISDLFSKPEPVTQPEPAPTPQETTESAPEYPDDMPRELYIPYIRAKQKLPLNTTTSTFNKTPATDSDEPDLLPQNDSFPIPSDFDISDSLPPVQTDNPTISDNDFPIFKDIDFDTPIETPAPELSNSATKYCTEHNIEYETYHEFVATEKYLIYDHNDGDLWIMDDETWVSSKVQRESPVPEMISLAHQNGLTPVLYLESQNIMDIEGTTEKFESMGIRVIKKLDEL